MHLIPPFAIRNLLPPDDAGFIRAPSRRLTGSDIIDVQFEAPRRRAFRERGTRSPASMT
ncbi:hypothetical protein [Burkholderia multivorans]|jgi:hypothetical protein|uniref:Uncharacterized protein n=1 Tax=Burkholderia multivorans CGD2 TaxID=513052 RepID=B9BK66_9BURK|nr:hypothetical protein [Burkholderia multivorans]EEE08333.1 hypothetical protein BURMUCGD2_5474 [Burkholderia multivorans CGD2]EEE16020.1 hypothetical protein BURMUCGD2M_5465 [Burkholderia multivorans CGD2M]EJO61799.1 hypothetical protein BURMUCF1_A1439 [Burkholderia multivorans ATCC BAA-247]MCO1340685.1 hypothetical protein [Burkholderia multivorans]MCO1373026.1 hypothetical protein [Burkholderia multivorans]